MAIQLRRGNEADLDISQLRPGETAVCLDSGKMIVKLSGGNYLTLTDTDAIQEIVAGKAAASHTHGQSDITGLETALAGKISTSAKGANGGVAELNANGKVPSSQLPSYVDDVLSYNSASAFPATGEDGKIYIAKDTNLSYRWAGSDYVVISPSLALGDTSSTAYRGDWGVEDRAAIGTLTDLQTSAKSSLVAAVNEVKTALGGIVAGAEANADVLFSAEGNAGTTLSSSSPLTLTSPLTSSHKFVEIYYGSSLGGILCTKGPIVSGSTLYGINLTDSLYNSSNTSFYITAGYASVSGNQITVNSGSFIVYYVAAYR